MLHWEKVTSWHLRASKAGVEVANVLRKQILIDGEWVYRWVWSLRHGCGSDTSWDTWNEAIDSCEAALGVTNDQTNT